MRTALAISALLLLGACNVSKNGNSVTVQYDQNTAENTAASIGNTAQNIGSEIANDVQNTGDKIENKVGNTDVHVSINKDEQTNSASGDTTTTTKTTKTEHKH
jgi:hypothetical protein